MIVFSSNSLLSATSSSALLGAVTKGSYREKGVMFIVDI